ncbi:MAG: hypothetical protein D6819_03945 [Gammaproteobacteria bacterium]|nr:MAG: hypothetical protein D6819_03945 [Gammaproteobacteria bacterium]
MKHLILKAGLFLLPLGLLAAVIPLGEKVRGLEARVSGLEADLQKATLLKARLIALGDVPEARRRVLLQQVLEAQGLTPKLKGLHKGRARFEGLTWEELVHLLAALERKGLRIRGLRVDASTAEVDF